MPPPGAGGKPSLVIAVGTKPGNSDRNSDGRMPPPGQSQSSGSGKSSPEEAGVVLDSEHCIDCANYHPDTGECDTVEGTYSPQDGCAKYFTPISGDKEPDADDQSAGPSDNDADDQSQPGGGQ